MSKVNVQELENAKTRILKYLEPKELELANRLIFRAVKMGFTDVHILPPMADSMDPSIKDLVGTKDNTLYFLYGKL